MTSSWAQVAPRKMAALLVALSVVLLLPACGVFASPARGAHASAASGHPNFAAGHAQHLGGAVPGDYCASVGKGATATATERPLSAEGGALLALAPVAPPYPVAPTFLPQSAADSYPPLSKASFYIRSTRVLR